MNHLVITVSADSSLQLLGEYADFIVLDKDPMPAELKSYKSVYIRSHFSTPELSPQNYRTEIEGLLKKVLDKNKDVYFFDNMNTVDAIVEFEDKWRQYEKFAEFMPLTKQLSNSDSPEFMVPIYKKRLSSRGNGVTWNRSEVSEDLNDWIIQETLDIVEEIRIYTINGDIYPIGAIRRSMTDEHKTLAINYRKLTAEEIDFATKITAKAPSFSVLGLDIAHTKEDGLFLMEVNRSPGFGAFEKLTNVNLADFIYR